jgi:hypothetical protein
MPVKRRVMSCYRIYYHVNIVCISALSPRHALAGARKIIPLLIRSLEGATAFSPLATSGRRPLPWQKDLHPDFLK